MKASYILIMAMLVFAACSKQKPETTHEEHAHSADETYTCPMHPQVVSDQPGTCPVCGMDLINANKAGTAGTDLMLTDSQVKLANITTQKISKKTIGQTVAINGRFALNEQHSEAISSRAGGRIEKLFVKETGQAIRKGEPLYVLYSETLLTLQQEYLLAKEQYQALGDTEKRYKTFLESAEKKLLLYGLTKTQISKLDGPASLQPRVTFLAPTSGTVTEIKTTEGQYVSEGQLIYRVEDVSSLWVEAELYPGETSLVKTGDRITLRTGNDKKETVEAEVNFLSPEFRMGTRIVIMRASVDNADGRFTPGQQVQIYLTHSSKEALAVPVDAVIRDGKGTHVYRQVGNNTFRPVMVRTGIETFDRVEITNGLAEGDTVAVSGAYLLYAELILKKGSDPMAGHNH